MKRRLLLQAAGCVALGIPWAAFGQRIPSTELVLGAYTEQRSLVVGRTDEIIRIIRPMACGRRGSAWYRLRGSEKTQKGVYRIAWINRTSRFKVFFGFNYPLPGHALFGYRNGAIGRAEYWEIVDAHHRGALPPQRTALGGHIGLHGLGGRDAQVHRFTNWTDGCLAVDDESIEQLATMVGIGSVVFVR